MSDNNYKRLASSWSLIIEQCRKFCRKERLCKSWLAITTTYSNREWFSAERNGRS